jgi:hypothetical protein
MMASRAAMELLRALYLFVPLIVASMVSAVILRFDLAHRLAAPIDFGAKVGGRRLFGDGKTWRGVVTAVVGASLGVAIQRAAAGTVVDRISVVDYRAVHPILFGTLLGLGATIGELPNSFVKRRLGIPRGKTARGPLSVLFWVWDQIDLLTLTWPMIAWIVHPSGGLVLASFVVALTVHPLAALIGFLLGARSSPR